MNEMTQAEMFETKVHPDLLGTLSHMVAELDRLRPVIENALPYTHKTHEFDDIVAMVMSGSVRLWTTPGSFLIVERVAYPRKVHYHIFLAGGDLDELRSLHKEVIAAAKADGADAITLTGRPGWTRALFNWGWQPVYTTMMLEV